MEKYTEKRLGWGLLVINQERKYFFLSFCLGIYCSHNFKQLEKKSLTIPKCNTSYIREIVRVVKADIIAIMVHSNLSTLFVVSRVLRPNVSPEWRLKPGFGIRKKCPFPLNRGVPSIELADTKNMRTVFFLRDPVCVPWIEIINTMTMLTFS